MNNLKKLRNEVYLHQKELGEYVNIPHSTISYLEKEERPFREIHIEKLTSFFNVTSDFLLGKTDYGYIIKTLEGNEIILTEDNYKKLGSNVRVEIISLPIALSIAVKNKKQVKKYYMPSKVVYRELIGKLDNYNEVFTTLDQYIEIGKNMTEDELRKAIRFISEYIFNYKEKEKCQ